MTLTLNLPDDLIRQLEEQAQRLNTSVESLAELKLRADLPEAPIDEARTLPDAHFDSLSRGVISDYRDVLERLA